MAPGPPAPAVVAAKPAPVTCADAAVILRGDVNDHKYAGPAKDGLVASACARDAWPAELMACIGTEPVTRRCLQKLSPEQWKAFDAALIAWNEQFPDETLNGEMNLGDVADDYVDCSDAIHDGGIYTPSLSPASDDYDFHAGMRRRAIEEVCDAWETSQRTCFRDATSAAEHDACRAQLDPADAQILSLKIASVDKQFGIIASLKKKPTAIDCNKVATAHYTDAAWTARLPMLQGPERKRALAVSRVSMTKACTRDAWEPRLRACIVAGGAGSVGCMSVQQTRTWDYPALGVFVKTGIPECDAHTKRLEALSRCAVPQQVHFEAMAAALQRGILTTQTSPEWQKHVGTECARLDADVRLIADRAGCKL